MRVESKEQVDYSGVSGSVGDLGGSANECDANYFTLQPNSSKFSHLKLNELESGIDRPLRPVKLCRKLQLL